MSRGNRRLNPRLVLPLLQAETVTVPVRRRMCSTNESVLGWEVSDLPNSGRFIASSLVDRVARRVDSRYCYWAIVSIK